MNGRPNRTRGCALLVLLACMIPAVAAAQGPRSSVRVAVDPRIELMGVIQYLSGYFLVTDHDFAYKQQVQAYFSPYVDHRAVRMFKDMSEDGFSFDAVPNAFLTLSAPPELARRTGFSERATSAAGGAERLEAFVAAARDFARATDFMRFYETQRATYARVVRRARPEVERATGVLVDYTGVEPRNSTVIIGMLLHDGGFGASVQFQRDSMEVYAVVGPHHAETGVPVFGPAERLMGEVWHEFGHSVINPLTREHWAAVERYEGLYDPIADQMRRWAYGSWEQAVNEHIIRAIETRLTGRIFGPEAGARERRMHVERGFRHLDALLERLDTYEASRNRFPTIAGFYRQFVEVFEEAAGEVDGTRHP